MAVAIWPIAPRPIILRRAGLAWRNRADDSAFACFAGLFSLDLGQITWGLSVKSFLLTAIFAAFLGHSATAQELIGSYLAYIGEDDLYNSNGERLSQPWQVLRQDRANFHKFGISQDGDEWDEFFSSVDNRAAMEQMIMNGSIEPRARRLLLQGDAMVQVSIYGRGSIGDYVSVTVY